MDEFRYKNILLRVMCRLDSGSRSRFFFSFFFFFNFGLSYNGATEKKFKVEFQIYFHLDLFIFHLMFADDWLHSVRTFKKKKKKSPEGRVRLFQI